jgi:phosphocarrier protein HPr
MTTRTTDGLVPRDGVPSSAGSPQSNSPATATMREALRRIVRVRNPFGLHPRAADRFVRTAKRYMCAVNVLNGELKANGKDLWDMIALSVFPDSDVILEVDGVDAAAALETLAEVLGAPSGEDYTI